MTKCMGKKFCKKKWIDEDNSPRHAVDKQAEPKRPPVFMVVYPKAEDPKLKAELENANNEFQGLDQAIIPIKEKLTLAKRKRQILKQNLDLLWKVRKDLEYFLKTNIILMKPLHQALCTVGGSNTVARACSAEEQLNDVIKILESRMTHETIQLSEEKQIAREIDKLRGMKSKFIACDARRAEIRDAIANRDSLKPGDKEKLIGTEMNIVSKELQLLKERIRQDTIKMQNIAKHVETWNAKLEILEEKMNKALITVQELKKKMKDPYENNHKLLDKAEELAAEKNAEALKVLVDSELSRDGRRSEMWTGLELSEMWLHLLQSCDKSARRKATVNEVCSEGMKFVQQANAAVEQQVNSVKQVQTKGPISIPKRIPNGRKARKNRAWAARAAGFLAVVVILIGLSFLRT